MILVLLLALLILTACGGGSKDGKRVIVLGIDGMDYGLTRDLIAQGELPNIARLAEEGHFQPLGTSAPPLSPVAWSNFITGMDPGGHGVFDFIHRDPQTMIPFLSTSKAEGGGEPWSIGGCQVPNPFTPAEVVNLRQGTPFWEVLEEHGVETWILRMPANYPPTGKATREISGMGTPDLQGTPGTFSFYTSKLFAFAGEDISGGEVFDVWPEDGVVSAKIKGPPNSLLPDSPKVETEFQVSIDPDADRAKLVIGDEERILEAGEWSDFVPIDFEIACGLLPPQTVTGVSRFFLRSVRPEFELYASPVNIDPMSPAQPISHPADYAAELAKKTGRFYTQGMPEDTKTLSEGVFSVDEFIDQAKVAGRELAEQYEVVLDEFESGLLFYYFGNLDQVSHMMWKAMDTEHPKYDPERDAPYAGVVLDLYRQADAVVGHTLENMGEDTTLIVMSDHGFASWRRAVHLNTWLEKNGFLALRGPYMENDPGFFANVDWSKTRAYGIGLNGLYVNMRGREKNGIVAQADKKALLDEIGQKLLEAVDPDIGGPIVTRVYPTEEYFRDRGYLEGGPDMIIGYAKHYKGSHESSLGEIPPEIVIDNDDAWGADHGMDHESVPGVLLTNRPLQKAAPSLKDLAAAILAEFGVEEFPIRENGD